MSSHGGSGGSILRQPRAVWAVAFACVIAFMGIGLVDPILASISQDLRATPAQTELLFTSYLLVTGVAMFFTSWVSSRIGAKRTLMIGLALIVVFALLAALSSNVWAIIGFRAGWGLGNALFISTALSTIVGAASGGTGTAIVLYEAALGIGIAVGPLLGGSLGTISWKGPFFGVTVLMAIAFVLIAVLLARNPNEVREPLSVAAPFRALGKPTLAVLAIAALFYNLGFFTLLAWTPYPLFVHGFGAMSTGYTFFGWGVAVAITSVWVAPLLTRRLARTTVLAIVLPLLGLDLLAASFLTSSPVALVASVVVGGLLLGINNTVLTECVMEATDLPRSVASSAYSGVRFLGGAIAPPLTAALAGEDHLSAAPFWFGAAAFFVSTVVILLGRRVLRRVDRAEESPVEEAENIALGGEAIA
ncbi:MFS transporter [Galbitalea sp. SE-J8]|uniref:MFS transporter n=1 Tax=Galbitalea sp. SE-J8 TaxID=3054952 RepID=UPI00259C9CAF|nr:MFS transporter [Galbitalea sp. SE-J8]MDM4764361.1 MFS transporter [Galbitalea sp. SE-J8]